MAVKEARLAKEIVTATHWLILGIQSSFHFASAVSVPKRLIMLEEDQALRAVVYIANLFLKFFNLFKILKVTKKHGHDEVRVMH